MQEQYSDEELGSMSDEELDALGIDSTGAAIDGEPGDEENTSADDEADTTAENEAAELAAAAEANEAEEAAQAAEATAAAEEAAAAAAAEDDSAAAVDNGKEGEGDDNAAEAAADTAGAAAAETKTDRVEEIRVELADLGDRLEAGEIDFSEYNKLNNELVEEREDLKATSRDNQREEKRQRVETEAAWSAAADAFLAVPGNSVVNEKPLVQDMFMSAYKTASERPEAQGKPFREIMDMAKADMIEAGFSGFKAEPVKKPNNKRGDNVVDLPVNLGDVQATDTNDTGNEFASLDGKEGLEFEEAFAALPKSAQDRYLEV